MFMIFWTGYMLEANEGLSEAQKDIRARNTFLLALDGDVDFQPDAIVKLVSLAALRHLT
jgi:chitin synthase